MESGLDSRHKSRTCGMGPLGTFSPWSVLYLFLYGWLARQDFCLEKDLSEERTREQFSSDILLEGR